jgi:hypothetical protein
MKKAIKLICILFRCKVCRKNFIIGCRHIEKNSEYEILFQGKHVFLIIDNVIY